MACRKQINAFDSRPEELEKKVDLDMVYGRKMNVLQPSSEEQTIIEEKKQHRVPMWQLKLEQNYEAQGITKPAYRTKVKSPAMETASTGVESSKGSHLSLGTNERYQFIC